MGSAWKSVRTRLAPSVAPVPRKSGTARVMPSRRGSKGARPKRRALIRGLCRFMQGCSHTVGDEYGADAYLATVG